MRSRKEFIVAKFEFLSTIRKKSFILTTLMLPLFFAIPVLLTASLPGLIGGEGQNIGFIDETGMLEQATGYIKYPTSEEAKAALLRGDIKSFFILPKDYLSTGKITVYSLSSSPITERIDSIDSFIVQNLLRYAKVGTDVSNRITNPPARETVTLDEKGNIKQGSGDLARLVLPYALAIGLLLSIMMSSNFLMQGIGEEKESRTGELLLSSISADQLLRGKIIGYGAIGLLQVLVWGLMAGAALSMSQYAFILSALQISWIIPLAVTYFFLGYSLFSVSIACAAAISPTAKEAQQTSSIFTMAAALPLVFSQFIILSPNSEIAKALTFFPYTAPVITMMRASLVDIPAVEIAASIGIMMISIILVMSLAGKIFRMGMLMQGKRATIREVIASIREK